MAKTAATKADKGKRETVACTIPVELSQFIEDYRWNPDVRMSRSEVVGKALADWAAQNGYKTSTEPVAK